MTEASATSGERPGSYCVRSIETRRGWQAFLPAPAAVKVDPISLILEAPEFLTGQGHPEAPVRVAVPVTSPGIRTDRLLLAVDEAGGITLAGCPNPDDISSAHMLAGDILATTGMLWRLPAASFLGLVEQPLGKPLALAIAERALHGWSDESLFAGLAAHLEKGRFPIVIVAPPSDGPAREARDYLKAMNLPVRLVDIAVFACRGIEVATALQQDGGAAPPAPPTPPGTATPPAAAPRPQPSPAPTAKPPASPQPRVTPPPAASEPPTTDNSVPPASRPGTMAGKRPPPPPGHSGHRK